MTLLAVLVALLAEHFMKGLENFRGRKLLANYHQWMQPRITRWSFLNSEWGVVLIMLPDVLIIGAIAYGLLQIMWGLPGLLFAIFILWHSMGPHNLYQQIREYVAVLKAGDENRIREVELAMHLPSGDGEEHIEHQVTQTILVESNNEIFTALFWFIFLGPAGAVASRFISVMDAQQLGDERYQQAVRRVRALIVWLPARVQAAGYAMVGSLMDAASAWKKVWLRDHGDLATGNERLLLAVGHAALLEDIEDRSRSGIAWVEAALSLVQRTAVVWVAGTAILTLANIIH